MVETKSFILSTGGMVRTVIKKGIIYPLTAEGIVRKLVGNTRWFYKEDIAESLNTDKDIFGPYLVEPIEPEAGINPENMISETGLILLMIHERSINIFQQILLKELISL